MNSKPRQAPPGGVSAVAHTLTANDAATLTLSVAEHLLADPASRFTDLGPGYYQARTDTDRKLRNHIRQLQALGFTVTITRTD